MGPNSECNNNLGDAVAMLIERQMSETVLTVSEAAMAIDMSVRSLQRRLAAKGTSFSHLLDEVRRQKWKTTAAESSKLPCDMHRRLGYAHPSILHRAIRRWAQEEQVRMER